MGIVRTYKTVAWERRKREAKAAEERYWQSRNGPVTIRKAAAPHPSGVTPLPSAPRTN